MTFWLALLLAFGDIAAVKSEPDLEKRSELALANAERDMDQARQAYQGGDEKTAQAALNELMESVDLSYDALQNAHTPPRKSKYYKRAELRVRALIRRLNSFRDEVSFDARPPIEAAIKKLSDVHDQLISDIMSRKK
ncbi:MAG TPA: hypothetical protein VEV17_11495 [Bryobacteraceae bacterium]|nr:hypothetical protein [Bryobacteraceae bacterium]